MSKETTKRLAPTLDVLRELYLKSGNQCAFQKCNSVMINGDGVFVGQICHIEAAMPYGQRFNSKQTNEERRSYENLMLMCYEHHKSTDDVDEFSVERLKEIKKFHEQKFTDIANILQESIFDLTTFSEISYSKCCKKLSTALNWGSSDEDLMECSKEANTWAEKLKKLPIDTRKIFIIMISRSTETASGLFVVLHEIQQVTGIPSSQMIKHFEMLERYGFLFNIERDDYGNHISFIKKLSSGWPFWSDLKRFTTETTVTLEELVVNLRFSLLD